MSRAGIETTSGESVGQSDDKGLFEWFTAPNERNHLPASLLSTFSSLLINQFPSTCRR